MSDMASAGRSKMASWGWGTLLLVSALLALNGVTWFFFGPDVATSTIAENLGLQAARFEEVHPIAASEVAADARRVAVYLTSIGTMGCVAAYTGFRQREPWAWYLMWVIVATAAALGGIGLAGGLGPFGMGMLVLAAIALTGQLLAAGGRPDISRR